MIIVSMQIQRLIVQFWMICLYRDKTVMICEHASKFEELFFRSVISVYVIDVCNFFNDDYDNL